MAGASSNENIFAQQESEVLRFWQENRIFPKLREKLQGKPKFSFIDGPITANNPMGVHHAWGRTLKDVVQRYRALCGYDQRFQNGFDCQGLWVEVEVEKDLSFDQTVLPGMRRDNRLVQGKRAFKSSNGKSKNKKKESKWSNRYIRAASVSCLNVERPSGGGTSREKRSLRALQLPVGLEFTGQMRRT